MYYNRAWLYFWNFCVFQFVQSHMCVYSVFYVFNGSAIYINIGVSNMGVTHVKWVILDILFTFSTPLYRHHKGAADVRSDEPGPHIDVPISLMSPQCRDSFTTHLVTDQFISVSPVCYTPKLRFSRHFLVKRGVHVIHECVQYTEEYGSWGMVNLVIIRSKHSNNDQYCIHL